MFRRGIVVVAVAVAGCGGGEFARTTSGTGGSVGAGGEVATGGTDVRAQELGAGGLDASSGGAGLGGDETAGAMGAGGAHDIPSNGTGGDAATSGTGGLIGSGGAAAPDAGIGGDAHCATRFFKDEDGDGFGVSSSAKISCTRPDGYAALAGGDCDDADPAVHPGAAASSLPRANGSYDYDCDGKETPTFTDFASCPMIDNSCPPPNHWTVPNQCDYLGMASSGNKDGWSLCWTLYSCDAAGTCGCNPAGTIPKCGKGGAVGMGLSWTEAAGYKCSSNATSDVTMERKQTCS